MNAKWLALELARARTEGRLKNAGELAEAAGVSRQTISRILNGRTSPDNATITKLATALGTSVPQTHETQPGRRVEEVWSDLAPYLGELPPHVAASAVELYQRAKHGRQDAATD